MTDPVARLGDRSLFPDLEPFAYLNHAAISAPSMPVRDAVAHILDDYLRRGVSALPDWLAQRERLRAAIARFIGGDPRGVGFVANTTRGVIDVAWSMPWQAGDRIITFDGEFPANITPWQRAAATFDLELELLPLGPFAQSHEAGLEELDQALARGARLVAVSAVQFQTGLRMPVEDIVTRAQAAGAEVFVDAIQACGVVPFDVGLSGVDYVSCGGHKWLMGPEGTGFVYVRPDRLDALVPRMAGWLSHQDGLRFLFEGPGQLRYDRPIKHDGTYFEGGAQNALGLAGLGASLALVEGLGVDAIFDHVQGYLDALEAGLLDRGFESARATEPGATSGILSVRPPDGHGVHGVHGVHALNKALDARGVACTTPDGWLRLAPHWPNAHDEVPRILTAVDDAMLG